jgi:hypothetical protein
MGLNYSYLLYFKRERMWDALQGVVTLADPHDPPPTTIQFPDHDLVIQIMTDFGQRFWFKGQQVEASAGNVYILPEKIEEMPRR